MCSCSCRQKKSNFFSCLLVRWISRLVGDRLFLSFSESHQEISLYLVKLRSYPNDAYFKETTRDDTFQSRFETTHKGFDQIRLIPLVNDFRLGQISQKGNKWANSNSFFSWRSFGALSNDTILVSDITILNDQHVKSLKPGNTLSCFIFWNFYDSQETLRAWSSFETV